DTDNETLSNCHGATTVQIGRNRLGGNGTDGIVELGKKAAAENIDQLRSIVSDAQLVMITAGMGGGTGTAVVPIVSSLARDSGALTICFVSSPFNSEGVHRVSQAEQGIIVLKDNSQPCADSLIVVPNQRILELVESDIPMQDAYKLSDDLLIQGMNGITDILTEAGEINLDFEDIEDVMRDQGTVLMGIGKASGENRAKIAAEKAMTSPILDENSLSDSVGMIVKITSPPDYTMSELDATMRVVSENTEKAQPIFGLVYKDHLEGPDEVIITIIASGSESRKGSSSPSTQTDRRDSPEQDNVISPSNSSEFVHLHNHSEYSLLDSTCRIPDMVEWAVENSSPALALTDHANMFGAWEFYNTAKSAGINPIVGCEVNVTANSVKTNGENKNILYHLTLLAEDAVGYRNLLELVSLGYTRGFDRKPSIDLDMLREYHGGIIALTGCINGLIPKLIWSDQKDEAVRNLLYLKDIMGEDNLFVEVQNHYLNKELTTYPVVVELANEFNLNIVGTNDCHYLKKSDHRMHDILQCIKTKKTVNDPQRKRFNEHFYFKNIDEIRDAFKDFPPEAIFNTTEIANRCNLILDYDRNVIPKFDVPMGFTQDSYFEKLCYDGLKQKIGGHLSDPTHKQLTYELNVIKQAGYVDYFLIVADYVAYANKQGYLCSARGSAASSLVSYALDIISFNPMEHGCMFDRFINPDKLNPPDIDIDVANNARDDMINYLMNKYGHDSVGKIATFATFGAKSSIKDVGRALEVPYENIVKVTELIPPLPESTLDKVIETVPEFRALAENSEFSELIAIGKRLEGMKRHVSCHASGIAISKGSLVEYAPLFKDRHGEVATQFEGKTVENVGILKFDTLGVRSLSEIAECLNMIHENHGHIIALEDIPLEDKMTYSLISEGLLAGLFQLETSPGMYDVVTQLKPDNFEVFSAIVPLYRPGPIRSGMMQQFIDRKNGVQPIEYLHPSLESALKSTFGLCIYQEQIMQIACDLAGYTVGEADILREAFGKTKEDIINQHRSKFIVGALENGITKVEAEKIFDFLKSFGRYAFLKSHSITYSLLSYRMAYLKTHYPQEFMASLMNDEAQDSDKNDRIRDECAKLSEFLNVDINL
ncbi:DNA polymerase III subunit alpha, partial [Candidatus Poribacteria bacterium]|nr:DNA polymerase III subunit alpha [Candidatus Poribacteria bacterium]